MQNNETEYEVWQTKLLGYYLSPLHLYTYFFRITIVI